MELGHDTDLVESTNIYVGDPLTNLMVPMKKANSAIACVHRVHFI